MNAYEMEKGVTGARLHHRAVVLQGEAARAAAAARLAAEELVQFVTEGRERGWISKGSAPTFADDFGGAA